MNMPQEDPHYPRAPSGEIMREMITSDTGDAYVITCNERKDRFFLYKVVGENGELSKRLASKKTPVELRTRIL